MGPLAALVLALAAAHVQVADGSALQCYVCEPRTGDITNTLATLFKDQQPILKCEDFKKDDSRFVKTCPGAEYHGCLTQSVVAGQHVMRTCGDIKINDCRVANGIEYCYCSTALCNGLSQDPPPDDEPEDSVEGSASGEDATKHKHMQTPGTTATPVAPPTTHAQHVKSGAPPPRTHPLAVALAPLLALVGALVASRTD